MRRRRADDLFDRFATFEALCAGALRAAAAKRRVPGPAAFLANLETEVLGLERELRSGAWRPSGYVSFEVLDPKRRLISAAPFRDRVVHQARRRGLPIGNLTSQFFANVYLDRFDHFVTEVLRAPYLRYVDDFALFADDPERLAAWRARAEAFLSATACAGCATAGGPAACRGRRWSSASPRGWRTRRTPRRGGCAARSSGAGGSHRADGRPRGPDRPRSACVARRFVEQQSGEPALGESQQERCRRAQRQQRLSCFEHAPLPEPARPRPRRARVGASRAGHDESAPPDLRGGVTPGARPGPPGGGDGRRSPVARGRPACLNAAGLSPRADTGGLNMFRGRLGAVAIDGRARRRNTPLEITIADGSARRRRRHGKRGNATPRYATRRYGRHGTP